MDRTNPLLHRQIYEYFRCLVVNGKEELIEDRKGFKVLKAMEVEFPDLLERHSTLVSTAIMAPYIEFGSPLNYHNRLLSNSKKVLVARGECHESELQQSLISPTQVDNDDQRKRKERERTIQITERPPAVISPPATMHDDMVSPATTSAETAVPNSAEKPKHQEDNDTDDVGTEVAKRPRVDPSLVQAVLRELGLSSEISSSPGEAVAQVRNQGGGSQELPDMVDPVDDSCWDAAFQLLVEFNNRYGHVHVPQHWTENEYLGNWVHQQREYYRLGLEGKSNPLTQDRIDRLQSLGFSWTPKSEVWNQRFGELLEFRRRFNHTNTPQKWSENKQLGSWVNVQRRQYQNWIKGAKSSLTSERRAMLESIGFRWKLRENKRSLGHAKDTSASTEVTATTDAGDSENNDSCSESSSEKTPSSDLDDEEEQEVSSSSEIAGVEATHRRSLQWNERYQQLLSFKQHHGHCNVPQKWKENKQLGKWCSHQRMHYHHWLEGKYTPLTEERRLLLESIGFVTRKLPDKHWTQRSWDERYKQLLEYRARFGNTNVPKKWPENRQLGIWVMNQRTQYQRWLMEKPTTLTTERREMLESIGFDAGKYRNLVASKQRGVEESNDGAMRTGNDEISE
eukprot:scaffold2770_cov104-Cylindrotheca_fusiformis.AAC.7